MYPSLGAPAAERDINVGLSDYFVESKAFERIRSGAKTIVLGNRGAGKSAIFKMMAERERANGAVVLELAPEDYSYEMLSQTMASERSGGWAKLGSYAAAWKYLIYVLVMRTLVKDASGRLKKSAEPISKYLRDRHGISDNVLDTLIGYLKRLETVKLGRQEVSLKSTEELHHLYKLDELQTLMEPLDSMLESKRVII